VSFFDDEDETQTVPRRSRRAGSSEGRPRSTRGGGGGDHELVVRRRIALGIAIVVLIVIVLVVRGCVQSEALTALKEYDHEVATLVSESNSQVSLPLFTALTNASNKTAIQVETQINQLRLKSQELASHASSLSVPGELESAQRSLVLAMNLREETMTKLAGLIGQALGSGASSSHALTLMAGDMEIFLASDVLFSQRVIPYVEQTLAAKNVAASRISSTPFLPNLGWLEPETMTARVTGKGTSSESSTESGTHGSALLGVSVGTNKLAPEPEENHVKSGANPTFTVAVENDGTATSKEVKVEITVTAEGKKFTASRLINSLAPESKVNVEIPVDGVPLNVGAKVEAYIQPLPGETETENNKDAYLAAFSG